MTTEEFYLAAEGNYKEVLEALGKEERILKYLRKFSETDASGKIRAALDAQDYETAFREAHNLKGMCLNIAITKLAGTASDLTESLRHGPTGDVEGLFAATDAEYKRVVDLIGQIQ